MATTDRDVMTALQYAVMEPPDDGATWPSGLWTQAEVLNYLNLRQSRYLKATRLWIGIANIAVLASQSRIALPADWILTYAATWVGSDGTTTGLERSDQFEMDHGDPAWETTASSPLTYLDYAAPTLQLQLAPLPLVSGIVQVAYVAQGAPLDGSGELYTVNDAFVTACAKYGALADMHAKDGRGKNPDKAAYAESRFQLGIDCARIILAGWV